MPIRSLYNSCLQTISLLLMTRQVNDESRQVDDELSLLDDELSLVDNESRQADTESRQVGDESRQVDDELRLLDDELRLVNRESRQLKDESRQMNPFQFLPSKIIHDLVTTTLCLQEGDGFSAASLELLLTSGKIRQFKIYSNYGRHEYEVLFQSLATACQNLEVLELTELPHLGYTDAPRALTELVRNSPNLKYVHSEVEFDLKSLRQCRKLKTVMLHFDPFESWYDFLKDEQGSFKSLDSLEVFTVCTLPSEFLMDSLIPFLQNCPGILSFGLLNTSRILAELYRSGVLPQIKLRCCYWGKSLNLDKEPEWIHDAIVYQPFVEELYISVYHVENITSLSTLKNLVFLDIDFQIDENANEYFNNVLKDIGHQLKYLSLTDNGKFSVDISLWLQNCQNLEVLIINILKFSQFTKPSVVLPKLKYLNINVCHHADEQRILSLFSDCNNIIKLSSGSFDDETLDSFLRKNSLSKLKKASFMPCVMTKNGFKKLFLNAPELEIIEASDFSTLGLEECEIEKEAKKALLETNHKALFKGYILRRIDPCGYHENQFGIYDEFIFKKWGCYLYR